MNFASLIQWFKKAAETKSKNAELISFLTLRRAIGWLGMLLPVVLVIGSMLVGKCNVVQPSISHYYYTNMREVFVGVLSAVSLFLFSYKGHSNLDSWASNVAGFFCLCVAIFPTDIESYPCQNKLDSFISWSHQEYIHLTCASLFFIVLALMSIFLFTKSDQPKAMWSARKKARNRIYIGCGVAMLLSIATIGIYFLAHGNPKSKTVFTFETLALLAFGISWLTKGETLWLWRDKSKIIATGNEAAP